MEEGREEKSNLRRNVKPPEKSEENNTSCANWSWIWIFGNVPVIFLINE